MSKTIGKASLEADEEGLVTLQCDRCKSRIKMDCAGKRICGGCEEKAVSFLFERCQSISKMLR